MTIARFSPLGVVSLREAMDRLFTVPVQINPHKVEAKFTSGVLEPVLPKADNVKPRTIKINASAK